MGFGGSRRRSGAAHVPCCFGKEDVEMRTEYDFSPLFRSTVGFDRMFDLLQHAAHGGVDENYPPYDIERTGEDSYRVTLAVAGFKPDDLNVVAQQNMLVVTGERRSRTEASGEQQRQVLHRGIAGRSFERRFELADHVKVAGADLADGLLHDRAQARDTRGDAAAPDRGRQCRKQRAPRTATAAPSRGTGTGRISPVTDWLLL